MRQALARRQHGRLLRMQEESLNDCCRRELVWVAKTIDESRSKLSWWFRLMGAGEFVHSLAGFIKRYAQDP